MKKKALKSLLILFFILNSVINISAVEVGINDQKIGEVGGINMSLHDNSGKCQLSSSAGKIGLKIPWPCNFHRTKNGDIRVVMINDISIVLLESAILPHGLLRDCITHLQAIKVINEQIYASEYQDKVATCPSFQWDEKIFSGLFENQ